MPALVFPLLAFTVGVGLAWAAADEFTRLGGSALGTRSLILVALLGLLLHAPIAAYFLAFHPDWAFAYVVDTARLPGVVPSAIVLACAAAPPAGFVLAARVAGEHRLGRVLELGGVSATAALIALLPGVQRLGIQATYQQYHGDFGILPIAGSRLGLAVVTLLGVLVAAIAWTASSVRRMARGRVDR